ncbi:MAG: TetR/AcrR family transcriptional regulator [Pseudomonadota bacterium]|nr:TetR/AcrR family transcriptional regulator [Pseudomonadota bacterium]
MHALIRNSRSRAVSESIPARGAGTDMRESLLNAAFEEILRSGFQAAGLSAVLRRAGATKGALYHHFENKDALGLAVIDERVREEVFDAWLRELEAHRDPVDALQAGLAALCDAATEVTVSRGCTLENLSTEMSPVSEAFRERIQGIYRDWRALVRRALERGIKRGYVAADVSPADEAMMFVVALQGCTVLAKNERSLETYRACLGKLAGRLDALRA